MSGARKETSLLAFRTCESTESWICWHCHAEMLVTLSDAHVVVSAYGPLSDHSSRSHQSSSDNYHEKDCWTDCREDLLLSFFSLANCDDQGTARMKLIWG